jgi:branched-chain amino acid aminotransferase
MRLMPVRLYRLTAAGLGPAGPAGPGLDSVSLQLPDGVYTTLRTYRRDHIVGLTAHLQRLADSLAAAGRARPLDLPAIRAGLRQVIAHENSRALRLRITVPFDGQQVYIGVEPFESFPPESYSRGVRCATSRLVRALPAAKHTAFIAPSRAARAEVDPDIHELLMVDETGQILEGFSSNFFAVTGGVLHTAGEGVLAGVTRQIVLAEAAGRVPVAMAPVTVDQLPGLAEAFITSSGREVMPVRQVDRAVLGDPGPVTRLLMALYHDHILREAELP